MAPATPDESFIDHQQLQEDFQALDTLTVAKTQQDATVRAVAAQLAQPAALGEVEQPVVAARVVAPHLAGVGEDQQARAIGRDGEAMPPGGGEGLLDREGHGVAHYLRGRHSVHEPPGGARGGGDQCCGSDSAPGT